MSATGAVAGIEILLYPPPMTANMVYISVADTGSRAIGVRLLVPSAPTASTINTPYCS